MCICLEFRRDDLCVKVQGYLDNVFPTNNKNVLRLRQDFNDQIDNAIGQSHFLRVINPSD